MKSHKLLPVVAFIGLGILGFIFAYNFIYSLAAKINPVIPMEAMVFALPIAIGLLLVPYAVKSENRKLIYIGNMISVVFSLIFVYQTASLCLSNLSGALNIALLITMIWPLLTLAASLTMMAFYKKADFKRIHNIALFVALGGIVVSFLITLITIIVISIINKNGLIFLALLPTLFVFLAVAPVIFMAFSLKDQARLVKLEVPEWVKPVKPAPTPKAEPKVEKPVAEQNESTPKEEVPPEPAEPKEDAPKE